MSLTRYFAVFALVAMVGSTAFAQDTAKKCTKCPAATSTASVQQDEGECTQCPVMTAALAKLPKMTYKVGEESTCCSESAATLAKKHSLPVHFVVAEKSYEDKMAAYTALVETTESFVNKFITPCKCEVSGKTSIAGKSCDCEVMSGKYAAQVKTAVDAVKMTYKVGDESCGCPNQAAAMAKAKGAKTEYVVGKECTSCELTARMNLAHAKYKAAVAAINSASSKTESGS